MTVDITQGFDIRVMTDEHAHLISQLKLRMIHFAWDNYEFDTFEKLKKHRKNLLFNDRRLSVYVLTNFNTTHEQDLERVYKLKEIGYTPYIMIYSKGELPAKHITRQLQRWCNNRFIFRACERFEDYKASADKVASRQMIGQIGLME